MKIAQVDTLPTETSVKIEPRGEDGAFSGLTNISLGDLVSGLVTLSLIVAAVIFFFMLVIGGIRWIASGGDKGQTEAARGQITAALIGLVIVFAAWAIANILATFFGITILNFELPQILVAG